MKIKQVGSNQTELWLENGTVVFFSYETPVCAYIPNRGHVKTNQKYSVTTSKHINKWLEGSNFEMVDQSVLDNLIK